MNGDSPVECVDVESVDLRAYDAAFIDPARRGGGRRTFDVNAYSPPWSFVTAVLAQMPAAAAKVAPGIPHELIPAGIETEWVSVGGGLKEAVLWAGLLTDGSTRRRATLLPSGATMQATADADEPAPTGAMRRYLYEPDNAVVRAHLIGDLARSIDGVLLDAIDGVHHERPAGRDALRAALRGARRHAVLVEAPARRAARARRRRRHHHEARLGDRRRGPAPRPSVVGNQASSRDTRA